MRALLTFSLVLLSLSLFAQDPLRFQDEVAKFKNDEGSVNSEKLILFTGSSSIRLWVDFDSYFPNNNVLNRGFGGSETSDLIYYADELILKYKPEQVFIYEGDNDLNSGKKPNTIIKDMKKLIGIIHTALPKTEIVLLSAKPSIARKQLKETYITFNKKLKGLESKKEHIKYVDVWSTMFNADGTLMEDIFIEDGLHMNKKGYDLWIKQVRPALKY